ncbi:MAG: P27 family phage terminase small subunit [Gammaproteobacteria bacterium]|nr:P27 family phage terminase small subunit [Gammaproteobacteria bacterium]
MPSDLSPGARAVWKAVTAAVAHDHFRASDAPLLRTYCEACALADEAAAELAANGAVVDGKLSPWLLVQEKASRTQSTLALRLRLCPSSRTDPKTLARNPGATEFQPAFSRLERK